MKRWFLLSSTILLVVVFADGQEKSDIFYNLEANIDLSQNLINSSAKISFPGLSIADSNKVYFKLKSPQNNDNENIERQVKRVTDEEGRELKFIVDGQDKLITVFLPTEPISNDAHPLTIEYSVPLSNADLKALGYYLYPSHDNSTSWYPILLDKNKQNIRFADFDISLNYPKNFEVLSSGLRVNKNERDNSVNANYLANHIEGFSLAFGGTCSLQEVEKGGIHVLAFSPSELSAKFLKIAEQAADAAVWYKQTYGFFPTKNIGIVSGYKTASGGFPMPNLFMIHQGRLYTDFTLNTTAHELGHYFWGLYVFGDKESLNWLMLANGIWIDHLYLAEKTGQPSLTEFWHGRNQELFNWLEFYQTAELANYDQRLDITQAEEDLMDYDYHSFVRHAKGAVAVYLEAQLLGKDRFLALQKRILTEYRYRRFSVDDFIKLLIESGVSNAADFFKVWQRGDAHLGYKIEKIEKLELAGSNKYRITVSRTGNVPYPIDIEIKEISGKTRRLVFSGLKRSESFEIATDSLVSGVLLDPDGVLPIWNTSNNAMRAVNVRAMFRAGISQPAVILAQNQLQRDPTDELTRSLMLDEFFKLGRYQDILQVMTAQRTNSCSDRASCLSLISLAAAMSECRKTKDAAKLLKKIQESSQEFGLKSRWELVNTKVTQ